MSYRREIIVLANSFKKQARCIAGKCLEGGVPVDWIRPVNLENAGGALTERDIQYDNGKTPVLGDVVAIQFQGRSSHAYQPENHSIDDNFYWIRLGQASRSMVRQCVDIVNGPLWINNSSSGGGQLDRIDETEAQNIDSSLKFIEVSDLTVSVLTGYENKKDIRGTFSINNFVYKLKVTDPVAHSCYLERGVGYYKVGECFLCISISEPFNGFAYKLIAAIFAK